MLNITQNMNESNNLFLNFGFSPNFFSEIKEEIYIIERNPMRKISSANAVSALPIEEQISQKKIYDAEDKELYQQEEEDNWSDLNKNDNINSKEKIKNTNSVFSPFSFNFIDNNTGIFSSYSQSQIVNLTKIIEEMNQSNEKRKVIKAYKSKLKSKFYRIYESNSKDYLEKVKYKLFHKCCFPNCGRTFSSSGWLKAHFEEHIKDLKKNSFNILFEKFINDKNFKHSLNQKNFANLRE
jgi:hypothetical protein